jgi:hypothetical protein
MANAVLSSRLEDDGTFTLLMKECGLCGKSAKLAKVPVAGFHAWLGGAAVQDALPQFSASERELLLTGLHAECFTAACGPEDE